MLNSNEINIHNFSTYDLFDELIASRNYQTLRLCSNPCAVPNGRVIIHASSALLKNRQAFPTLRKNKYYELRDIEQQQFTGNEIFGLSAEITREQFQLLTGLDGKYVLGTFIAPGFTFNKGDLYPQLLNDGTQTFAHSRIAKKFNTLFRINSHEIKTTSLDGLTIISAPGTDMVGLTQNGFEELASTHGPEMRITIVNGSDQAGHKVISSPDQVATAISLLGKPNQIVIMPNLHQPVSLGVSEDLIYGTQISSIYTETELANEPDNLDKISRVKYGGASIELAMLGNINQASTAIAENYQINDHSIKEALFQGINAIKIFRDQGTEISIAMGVMIGYNHHGDRVSGVTDPTTRIRGFSPLLALLHHYFLKNQDKSIYNGAGELRLAYTPPGKNYPGNEKNKLSLIDKVHHLGYSFGMYHPNLIIIAGLSEQGNRNDFRKQIEENRIKIRNQNI
jgi:hypothetical protein